MRRGGIEDAPDALKHVLRCAMVEDSAPVRARTMHQKALQHVLRCATNGPGTLLIHSWTACDAPRVDGGRSRCAPARPAMRHGGPEDPPNAPQNVLHCAMVEDRALVRARTPFAPRS